MSVQKKPCARRLGLLCFPVSTALCAASLWTPSTAQAAGFHLSPRGPGQDQAPVPYEPYEGETGGPTDRDQAQDANDDQPNKVEGENPGNERGKQDPDAAPAEGAESAGNTEEEEAAETAGDTEATDAGQTAEDTADNDGAQAAEQAPNGEEEIQYDQAPAADQDQPPAQEHPQDPDAPAQQPGQGEQEAPEMEFGDAAPGEGEEVEMEFGEAAEGEEGEQEMQFSDEPGADQGEQEMEFSDEGEQEMQFSDDAEASDDEEPPPGFMFEDISEDEEALAKELQSGQRQAKGVVGTVRGTITGSDGQEVMGASVETKDKKYLARSGVDGTFELKLNPGVYTLRVFNDGYEERFFEGIEVKAKEDFTLDAQITPLPGAVQTMIIEEEVAKEGNVGQAIKRQKSVATRDIMSREEMSKSGGSSTSSVARRIVGSTIVGGRYIFVRGLGHRYGNTLLDGARVPSPNPDLRTVPLDIFPTAALSAINVQKTFTPDVPADFAGGSVQLETRELPERFTFKVGASMGGNTQTTFRQQLTSQGVKGADAFGLGNKERGMSDELKASPNRFRLVTGNVPGTYEGFTPDQLQEVGRSLFLHTLVKSNTHAPMNYGGNMTIGNSWSFGREGKFGILFAGGYQNQRRTLKGSQRFFNIQDSPTEPDTKVINPDSLKKDLTTFRTGHRVALNGILLAKLKLDGYNSINLTGLYSRDTSNAIQRNDIKPQGEGFLKVSDRIRYTVRSVAFSQIKGRHQFPHLADAKLDWFYSFAGAQRDDPAMRQIDYLDFRKEPQGSLTYDVENGQITTQYLDLEDTSHNAALNLSVPFSQWTSLESLVKIGAWAEAKDRSFTARSIKLQEHSSQSVSQAIKKLDGRFEDIVKPQNVDGGLGQDPSALFVLNENTQPVDNYVAEQIQFAGYGLVNLPLTYRLKLSGGVRYEYNLVKVTPNSPFKISEQQQEALDKLSSRLRNSDFFPSIGLTFDLNKTMKLRLSGSRTTARPEMRELAPFVFNDFLTGFAIAGYPHLESTQIWNADLRWEWFIAPGEVLSTTIFYKNFEKPIEAVIGNTQQLNQSSFRNAKAANNVGFEIEGKKNFAFIAPGLRNLSAGVNFAYVYSRVKLNPKIGNCDEMSKADPAFDLARCQLDKAYDGSTSRERPLQDQSPFVVNAFLDYDLKKTGTSARMLYNTFGRRIFQIGGAGVPDIYEESVHSLDLQIGQAIYRRPEQVDDEGNIISPARALQLKLSVGNLLNYPSRFTQEKVHVTRRVLKGANISLGLSWNM